MNSLRIDLENNKLNYYPGDTLNGSVLWSFQKNPEVIDINLLWYTKGKGTSDVEIVDRTTIISPLREDRRDFSFSLPETPYSFSGKLISLIWAIEAVVQPFNESERVEIVLSPTGEEVLIGKDG